MLWPLVCAGVYLLLTVRVLMDAALEVNSVHSRMRLTVRAWGLSLCMDRPVRFDGSRQQAAGTARRLKRLWPFLRAALCAVRWGQTDVLMRIGTDEASVTALIAGAVRSAASMLQAIAGQCFPCDVRIQPDFYAPGFVLAGRCIFSLAPGDIMFAVLREAVKKTQKEGFKWLSIPLRA